MKNKTYFPLANSFFDGKFASLFLGVPLNLRRSSDSQIVKNLKRIKESEQDLLIECLRHLKEVETRRIFSALRYPSLHKFVVDELGYSDDEAQRRISAMRVMKELPEIEAKIENGSLTLTNIGMASSLFKKEKKKGQEFSPEQKLALFEQLEHKSTREAASEIVAISPEALHRDTIRPISSAHLEWRFVTENSVEADFEIVKGLYAHSHPGMTNGELFAQLLKEKLEQHPKTAAPRVTPRQKPGSKAGAHRAVFQRYLNTCVNCGSCFATQSDHRISRARGGADSLNNLQVLCRNCNLRKAIEELGIGKMAQFLEPRCPGPPLE